jgi:hypothetical protein
MSRRTTLFAGHRLLFLLLLPISLGGCPEEKPKETCAPTSCPGCCDSASACRAGSNSLTCGQGGAACVACRDGEICQQGRCVEGSPCGPGLCLGCCSGEVCLSGSKESACGAGGGACSACGANERCEAGRCTRRPCDPSTCPRGCCFGGVCLPGTDAATCGADGAPCQRCAKDQRCVSGVCKKTTCGPGSCSGCCDASGDCRLGTSEISCGQGGIDCRVCSDKESCQAYGCRALSKACTAASCASGCCGTDGACLDGSSAAACGTAGAPCMTCGSNETCQKGACVCGLGACGGCCDAEEGDQCRAGTLALKCGVSGHSCKICPEDEACVDGSCRPSCSPRSCKDGCCEGTTCRAGTSATACGNAGAACQRCGPGEACRSGICNDDRVCSAALCLFGCCLGSVCLPGTADSACGGVGGLCQRCAPHQSCLAGRCAIRPSSSWEVSVVKVSLDATKSWDPPWDDPRPDLFVELTVGNQTRRTRVVANDYSPIFNEHLLIDTAKNLMGVVQLKVWDHDALDASDLVAACSETLYESELEAGSAVIYACGSSADLQLIVLAFSPAGP